MSTLAPVRHSCNPSQPLKRGQAVSLHKHPCAYLFRYTSAPTRNSLSDIREHEDIIPGLNRLDADCNLAKRIRKQGRHLHAVLHVQRVK